MALIIQIQDWLWLKNIEAPINPTLPATLQRLPVKIQPGGKQRKLINFSQLSARGGWWRCTVLRVSVDFLLKQKLLWSRVPTAAGRVRSWEMQQSFLSVRKKNARRVIFPVSYSSWCILLFTLNVQLEEKRPEIDEGFSLLHPAPLPVWSWFSGEFKQLFLWVTSDKCCFPEMSQ